MREKRRNRKANWPAGLTGCLTFSSPNAISLPDGDNFLLLFPLFLYLILRVTLLNYPPSRSGHPAAWRKVKATCVQRPLSQALLCYALSLSLGRLSDCLAIHSPFLPHILRAHFSWLKSFRSRVQQFRSRPADESWAPGRVAGSHFCASSKRTKR